MTQKDLAFLLGCQSAASVCQYESHHRVPDLRTALAYQVIFRVPIEDMFPELTREVERDVRERRRTFRKAVGDFPIFKNQACDPALVHPAV